MLRSPHPPLDIPRTPLGADVTLQCTAIPKSPSGKILRRLLKERPLA